MDSTEELREETMKKLSVFLLALGLFATVLVQSGLAQGEYLGNMWIVNCQSFVTLRSEPSITASKIMELRLGECVEAYAYDEEYTKCYFDGEVGYVLNQYLSDIQPESESIGEGAFLGTEEYIDDYIEAINVRCGTDRLNLAYIEYDVYLDGDWVATIDLAEDSETKLEITWGSFSVNTRLSQLNSDYVKTTYAAAAEVLFDIPYDTTIRALETLITDFEKQNRSSIEDCLIVYGLVPVSSSYSGQYISLYNGMVSVFLGELQ